MNKLSIIILNYNTPDLVYDCLLSIKKFVSVRHEVILVDNGSDKDKGIDETEYRRIMPENCQLIISETNLGFGKGNNLGAKEATGDFLWFLNSDTVLVDSSAEKLVNFIDSHKEIGALSPVIFHPDGSIQHNFFAKFQSLAGVLFRRYNFQKIDFDVEFFYTDIVIGAAMMVRKKLFDELNGFDPNIFMYLEDDDICKRMVDKGYKNAVLTTAKIMHKEGASIKKNSNRKKLYYDSQTYFWKKHNGFLPTLLMRIIRWPYKLIRTR
jgi:GT2 family glycosyltransferase